VPLLLPPLCSELLPAPIAIIFYFIRRRLHELFHPGMTSISSRDDFHLGVWSFTFECLHDLEQKCVRPGMISSRSSAPG